MAALGGLAIALSVLFGALVLVLLAEVYYVFYWKRRRVWNRRMRINNVDAERVGFDFSRETGLVGGYSTSPTDPEFVTKLCSQVMGTNSSLYMQGVLGGPRLLFTIKEETKEDMEYEESNKSTLQSKFNMSDDEKCDQQQEQQWQYAYSIGLISQQPKKQPDSPLSYYKSLRAVSPSLQPITTYSELPKSVLFQSRSASESSSPASCAFSQPSSPPLYRRSGSLSSPSWRSSSTTSPCVSERRFESPAVLRSSSYREQQQQNFYSISNPIYEEETFFSPRQSVFSRSSQNTTPFRTPVSSPSMLMQRSDTPPLTPPLTPIRAPTAAYSIPLLKGPLLLRNLSGSTNSSPSPSLL